MRIMPNGTNSFGYSGQYITNASGIYIHTTIPANNTWTQVCAGRYHGAIYRELEMRHQKEQFC